MSREEFYVRCHFCDSSYYSHDVDILHKDVSDPEKESSLKYMERNLRFGTFKCPCGKISDSFLFPV